MSGDLDRLLERGGLEPATRLLVRAICLLWPGDWDALGAVFHRSRELGVPRANVEEALLQATLFFGFPRVVTAFGVLERAWPPAAPPQGGEVPRERQPAAGRELFDAIYGQNAETVRERLRCFHAGFHDFVLEAAYGRILARPGLPAKTRELLAVGALAVLDQVPQLVAHARGARTFGAEQAELRECLVTALGESSAVDELIGRV